jgi:hypothetical protein
MNIEKLTHEEIMTLYRQIQSYIKREWYKTQTPEDRAERAKRAWATKRAKVKSK